MLIKRIINRLQHEVSRFTSSALAYIKNPYSGRVRNNKYLKYTLLIPEGFKRSNRFDIFARRKIGSWDLSSSHVFPWHKDFIYGGGWGLKWHKLLSYKNKGESDVKIPWELGRGHLFTQLALGGGESKELLISCINDFTKKNPLGYGVQWQCPMDVSIRLVNLILAEFLIINYDNNLSDKKGVLDQQLHEHFNYISKNSEVFQGGFKNNHYLAVLLGKAWYCALIVKDFDACDLILKDIESEIEDQYLSDGGNFEGSVAYHFLSTEIIILAVVAIVQLYRSEGEILEITSLLDKIKKAVDFSNAVVSSSGYPSRVGDDDSGMVLRPHDLSEISLGEKNRYLASNRLKTFNLFISLVYKDDCVDLLSPISMVLLGVDDTPMDFTYTDGRFSEFGLYKYRLDYCELFFRHIGLLGSAGHGGHNHMDDMSFELFVGGNPVIVDPGTYCYTSNVFKRNYYRDAAAHNGVLTEARPFKYSEGQKGLFKLLEPKGVESIFESLVGVDKITSNRSGVNISRQISYLDQLIVNDAVSGGVGEVRLTIFPGLNVHLMSDSIVISDILKIELVGQADINIVDSKYSDFYLNERATKTIVIKFTDSMSMTFLGVNS